VINDADELPEPTPEPAPYVLLGTGCFALSIIGWRRQRAGVGSLSLGSCGSRGEAANFAPRPH
jgi:hypothetical protein